MSNQLTCKTKDKPVNKQNTFDFAGEIKKFYEMQKIFYCKVIDYDNEWTPIISDSSHNAAAYYAEEFNDLTDGMVVKIGRIIIHVKDDDDNLERFCCRGFADGSITTKNYSRITFNPEPELKEI